MIAIIKKEFRDKRTSLLVYCLVVVGLVWLYIGLYPSIQAQSAALSKVFESLGPSIKAFGIKDIGFDTLEKFLSIELFGITWPILTITFVAARTGQSLAGEIEKNTMGTLLALPISRANLFLSKYLGGLVALVIFVGITAFAALPIAWAYGIGFQAINFVNLAILCLLFSWALYSLGMLLSALLNEKGHVYLAMGGVMMTMYIANVVAGISDRLSWLQYGSLFHYFNASDVLIFNHTSLVSYAVFGGLILSATLAGMVWFGRKDIMV